MFRGFYKNEEATKGDVKDGWMHTGDAGFFDSKGRLTVIDRVKDIAQTRTGTKFSPQFIENKLKFSPYIGEAVILGADQDYLTAIICVRFSIISKWAEKARIPFTSYTNLSDRQEIYELIRSETAYVNESLPDAQKIRKFILLFKELDADDGELTRTRKVRRSVIAERYGPIIEALYSDGDRAEMSSEVTFEDGRKGKIEASMKIMQVDGAAARNEKGRLNRGRGTGSRVRPDFRRVYRHTDNQGSDSCRREYYRQIWWGYSHQRCQF